MIVYRVWSMLHTLYLSYLTKNKVQGTLLVNYSILRKELPCLRKYTVPMDHGLFQAFTYIFIYPNQYWKIQN